MLTQKEFKTLLGYFENSKSLPPLLKKEVIHSLKIEWFVGDAEWWRLDWFPKGILTGDLFDWSTTIKGMQYWAQLSATLNLYER